jgi:hypothetical protein
MDVMSGSRSAPGLDVFIKVMYALACGSGCMVGTTPYTGLYGSNRGWRPLSLGPYPHVSVRGSAAPGRETCEEHGAWIYQTSPCGMARPLHPYCCDKDLCMTGNLQLTMVSWGSPAWPLHQANLEPPGRPRIPGSQPSRSDAARRKRRNSPSQPQQNKRLWQNLGDVGSSFYTEWIFP